MVRILLEFTTFVHSTEDEDRVLEALSKALPSSLRHSLLRNAKTEALEGYFGNIIKSVRLLIGKGMSEDVLRYILCGLSGTDRSILLSTLEGRIERRRTRLHLRLSKQDLYHGRIVLSEGSDVVKIIASFEGVKRNDIERFLRELGENCVS